MEEWCGSVVRSAIDPRVWVAVLADTDTVDGAMGASTSARRCKKHVEDKVRSWGLGEVRWAEENGEWVAYRTEADRTPRPDARLDWS